MAIGFRFTGNHAATTRPAARPPAGGGDNWAKDRSSIGANDGTEIDATWANRIKASLEAVVTGLGGTLADSDTQIVDAIVAYVAAEIADIPADKYLASVGGYNASTNTLTLTMSDGSTVAVDLTALVADAVTGLIPASEKGAANGVATLDSGGKVPVSQLPASESVDWSAITGKPSTFTPSAHTHPTSEITGLDDALAGKSPTNHTHPQTAVTNLVADLAAKLTAANFGAAFPYLDPYDLSLATHVTNLDTALSTGFWRLGSGVTNGPGAWADWGSMIVIRRADVVTQIVFDYAGSNMAFRSASGIGGTPSWSSWKQVVHSGNISSYAATLSESGEVAVPNAGVAATWTHGLGARPRLFGVKARCLTAEYGYAVGDEIEMPTRLYYDMDSAAQFNVAVNADSTVVRFISQSAALRIPQKDTMIAASGTQANWRLVFWAIK